MSAVNFPDQRLRPQTLRQSATGVDRGLISINADPRSVQTRWSMVRIGERQQQDAPAATGELSGLLRDIGLAPPMLAPEQVTLLRATAC